MPLLRKRRVLAAKIESAIGTAEALTAAEAAFNIFEPEINPQVDFEERMGQGVFSPLPGVPGAKGGTCRFSVEIYGRGSTAGGVPAWASTFLPACGLVDDGTGLFELASEAPNTNVKTITIGAYQDGLKKVLRGCMGNAVIILTSGRIARVEFTFTGVWDDPTDVALLAPTYPTIAPLKFQNASAFSVGGSSLKVQECRIDLGNNVILRPDANDPSGYVSALITDRRITGSMNPEADLVANDDVYGDFIDRVEKALAIQLGSGTNRVDIDAPKLQCTNPQELDRDGLMADNIEFQLNRSAAAGDDELTIDFN